MVAKVAHQADAEHGSRDESGAPLDFLQNHHALERITRESPGQYL
jgi:hypothetical protein